MAARTSMQLTGYRVLVTRARAQAGALKERLASLGAIVVELPAIEIVPANQAVLDAAIQQLGRYDWLVFTSANGVAAFMDRFVALGLSPSALAGVQVGAIGRATSARLQEYGVDVEFMPERFIAESFVNELAAIGVAGKRILLPQAEIARDVVARGLREAGADVDVVVAYRTVLPDGHDTDDVRRLLEAVDIATFASPSAVRNAHTLTGGSLSGVRVVCIGPVTADAAREAGLDVAAVADEHTIDGLVEALVTLVEREVKGEFDGNHQ